MLVNASQLTNGKTETTSQSHKEKALLNPEVLTTSKANLLLVSRAPLVFELYPHFTGVPRGCKRAKQLEWELGAACQSSPSQPGCPALLLTSCVGLVQLLAFFEIAFISASIKGGGWLLCLHSDNPPNTQTVSCQWDPVKLYSDFSPTLFRIFLDSISEEKPMSTPWSTKPCTM